MSSFVTSVRAHGLYGRFDLIQDFYPGINILYGKNGSGKTTLIHILANALSGDFERFSFLDFNTIEIQFGKDHIIFLSRFRERAEHPDVIIKVDIDNGQVHKEFSVSEVQGRDPSISSKKLGIVDTLGGEDVPEALLPVAYFPAFRNVIDAWKSTFIRENKNIRNNTKIDYLATVFIRRWLIPFIPRMNYPSRLEIEQQLSSEEKSEEINNLIDRYLISVNSFLDGKKIVVNRKSKLTRTPPVEIEFDYGYRSKGLVALSSGEQQIMSMIYSANKLSNEEVVLIDEPEISLHVDWQRMLIRKMYEQASERQIIACTHSPIIGADHEDRVSKLGISTLGNSDI